MERCAKNLDVLDKHISDIKATNRDRLQEEYEKLVQGLRRVETERADEKAWANPGNIRISFKFFQRLVYFMVLS